jgi:site-specific DNA-cytosine methylase
MLTVADVFAGIGGFSLAFQRAGATISWQCEVDPYRQAVLREHFPGATLYPDVNEIPRDAERVDVICAGVPCEGFSLAGRRRGFEDERSALFYPLAEAIGALKPKWVVLENVSGLLSSGAGEDFASIIRELACFGYGVGWRVLRADWFGSPQIRPRVFVVGRFGHPVPPSVLFGTEYGRESLEADDHHFGEPRREVGEEDAPVAFSLSSPVTYTFSAPTLTSAGQFGVVGKHIYPRRLTPNEYEKLQGFPTEWTEVPWRGRHPGDGRRYEALGDAVHVDTVQFIAEGIINAHS